MYVYVRVCVRTCVRTYTYTYIHIHIQKEAPGDVAPVAEALSAPRALGALAPGEAPVAPRALSAAQPAAAAAPLWNFAYEDETRESQE